MTMLYPPLFPERSFVDPAARRRAEETPLGGTVAARYSGLCGTIRALEEWVRGGTFHRYGVSAIDALTAELDLGDALREFHARPGELKIEGELRSGYSTGMTWSVFFRRVGGIDSEYGGCSGYSTPEDAAYVCLSQIEAAEREAYLEQLVVGVA